MDLLVLVPTSYASEQHKEIFMARTGKYNALTDVEGILVGHFTDKEAVSGVTVVICPDGAVGGVDVRGAAPGTRETDLLEPQNLVEKAQAVVLSGGSVYGLSASDGVVRWLAEKGMQFTDYKYSSQEDPPGNFGFGPGNRGVVFVNTLIKLCDDMGVQVLLDTQAKKLLTGRDRRITGVLAEGKDGEVRINAKSIIMSTGGFLGNKELMKKYFHSYTEELFQDIHSDRTFGGLPHNGDGLLMAMEIGASDRGTVAFEWNANRFPWLSMQLPYYISAIVEIMDSGRHPSPIWVNQKGKRFADESNSQSVNSLYTQLHQVCHTIFDESIKQKILSR